MPIVFCVRKDSAGKKRDAAKRKGYKVEMRKITQKEKEKKQHTKAHWIVIIGRKYK